MAFDGILMHALLKELKETLTEGRISKIAQPEPEELLITLKTKNGLQKRLLMSANASLPLVYLQEENKVSPPSAPAFCMLLRKHIGSGRIIGINQPGLERILDFSIEHLDEMGDLKEKHLIIEIMGKYSNIIFTDERFKILDSIKRVPPTVSSVRTVLPGQTWFVPNTQEKKDAFSETRDAFLETLSDSDTLSGALFKHYTGFSTSSVSEFLYSLSRSDIISEITKDSEEACLGRTLSDSDRYVSTLGETEKRFFYKAFSWFINNIRENRFCPEIVYYENNPVSFSAFPEYSYLSRFENGYTVKPFDSVSLLLETYYRTRNIFTNMKQRSADLKKTAQIHLERAVKKYELQQKQLKDTESRDKNRLYGELLTAYAYMLPVGEPVVSVLNYYDNTTVKIPVDPDLSISDNAKKYYDKYGKQKRTFLALSGLIEETKADIMQLQSIITSIDIAGEEGDLIQIRREMTESGYLKKSGNPAKARDSRPVSKPFHYISSDGFDIYVGKNSLQNDELTNRFASGSDIFMHVKKAAGSHVIIKTGGLEVPDRTYEEAGALAVYYSSLRDSEKAEVDYTEKRNVKKPAGARPGFVVYDTNYSLMAFPDINGIKEIK